MTVTQKVLCSAKNLELAGRAEHPECGGESNGVSVSACVCVCLLNVHMCLFVNVLICVSSVCLCSLSIGPHLASHVRLR